MGLHACAFTIIIRSGILVFPMKELICIRKAPFNIYLITVLYLQTLFQPSNYPINILWLDMNLLVQEPIQDHTLHLFISFSEDWFSALLCLSCHWYFKEYKLLILDDGSQVGLAWCFPIRQVTKGFGGNTTKVVLIPSQWITMGSTCVRWSCH